MKVAIISVSEKGYDLSLSLKEKLDLDSTIIKTDLYHKNVKKYFPILFYEYDAIIAIMASGILVRSIAPLIESKVTDPAVLNIDDNGNFVISLLSGHLGGANRLTQKVASLIGATPVITTSTDVNKKLGIDVLAKDLYLSIDNTKEILFFNKCILEGKKISLTVNPNRDFSYLFRYLNDNTLETDISVSYSTKVNNNEIVACVDGHELILSERKIVAGMGCRRGKECINIYNALESSVKELNIDISRINELTSAEIKKDEKGMLELSEKLNIPINFVDLEKLELFESNDIQKSEFVKSKFGIYGVCEPSALIMAGFDSKLIYKKTSYSGVTIAIAVSK
ncbi:cobalt-precorrin 5A hydrolase [Methanobrevibacter sp.]|uniref:cobalt-precorrin 5A hydrolase n=1 Tax=Methanobrevibacter sp. TaxID=66852 RepID=UPI003865F9DA